MKALVVGAGIGGLAAALSLHRAGLSVVVCERSTLAQEQGAGIQLSPNACHVLRGLGLESAVREAGLQPAAIRLRDAANGRLLAERPLGPVSERRYGAPYLHVHREALHRVLREAVTARGLTLHTGTTCIDALITDERVHASFDGGGARSLDAHVLVAADGVHSRLRRCLFGGEAARASGIVSYRAMAPAAALPPRLREGAAVAWLAPGAHLVHYPVDADERVNLVAIVESGTPGGYQLERDAREAVAAAFAAAHPDLRAMVDAAGDWRAWTLHEHPPMRRWQAGPAVLLGDAAHPLLPFLAQGAAMAIEDAWVLGRALAPLASERPAITGTAASMRSAVELALGHYVRARQPRVQRVQRASRNQGRLFHHRPYAMRAARNAYLFVGSRCLPALAMARYDWLHGYDPLVDGQRVERDVAAAIAGRTPA